LIRYSPERAVTDWGHDLTCDRRMRASVSGPLIGERLGACAEGMCSCYGRGRRNGKSYSAVVCGLAEGFEGA